MLTNIFSGEKTSGSSADGNNQFRSLGGIERIERKSAGRKMDLLFTYDGIEFGCAEYARFNSVNDSKELVDGSFKLPKVMKDKLIHLVKGVRLLRKRKSLSVGSYALWLVNSNAHLYISYLHVQTNNRDQD